MSTFLDRTIEELRILEIDPESEKYKCLVAFAKCCDEDTSEARSLRMSVYRISNSIPLTPLTGSEEEWETVDGVVRNKRCHRVVKEGEVCYDKEAIVFYTIEENGQPINSITEGSKVVIEYRKSITEDSKVVIEFPYHVNTIYKK